MGPIASNEVDHFKEATISDSLGGSLRSTAIVVLAALQITGVLGCTSERPATEMELANKAAAEKMVRLSKVLDYGNGVYVFDCYDREFAKTISDFIETHPELEIVSTVTGTDRTGGTLDYVVITRPVAPSAATSER